MNKTIQLPYRVIQADVLHETLKAMPNSRYVSFDVDQSGILIRVAEEASEADLAAIMALVEGHDPKSISRNKAALERVRALDIAALEAKLLVGERDGVLGDILAALRDLQTVLSGSGHVLLD